MERSDVQVVWQECHWALRLQESSDSLTSERVRNVGACRRLGWLSVLKEFFSISGGSTCSFGDAGSLGQEPYRGNPVAVSWGERKPWPKAAGSVAESKVAIVRFIVFVIDTQSNSGNSSELAEIDSFNDALQESGCFILAAGIASPERAKMLDNRAGKQIVAAGSLNSERFYSGFWLIQAKDMEAAQQIALDASKACNREVELRPFL